MTEDKARREAIEARNTADSLAYQVERTLSELGSEVADGDKKRIEELIGQAEGAELVQTGKPRTTLERLFLKEIKRDKPDD